MKYFIILIIASFLSCQNNNILNLQKQNQLNDSFSYEEIKLIAKNLPLMIYFKPLNETKIKNMIEEFNKRYSPINNQFELILKINRVFDIFNVKDITKYCEVQFNSKLKRDTMRGFRLLGLKDMMRKIRLSINYILSSDLPLKVKSTLDIKKRSDFLICDFCKDCKTSSLCLKTYWNDERWDGREYPMYLGSSKTISLLSKFISKTKELIVCGFCSEKNDSNYSIPIVINKLILEYYSVPYNFFFKEELLKQIFYEMKSTNFISNDDKTNKIYLEYFKLDYPFKESNESQCVNIPSSLHLILPYYQRHPLFDLPFELLEKILNSKHKNLIYELQSILNYSVYADTGEGSNNYYFSLLEKTNFLWDEWIDEIEQISPSYDDDYLYLTMSENKLFQLIRISLVYGLDGLFSNIIYVINNLHSFREHLVFNSSLENKIKNELESCLKHDKDKIVEYSAKLKLGQNAIKNILINNLNNNTIKEILKIFNRQIKINNP